MAKRKKKTSYSCTESMDMLAKLQQMAIDEGNINLALKAEELKCKIASAMVEDKTEEDEEITKILVDFINDKQYDRQDTENICTATDGKEKV